MHLQQQSRHDKIQYWTERYHKSSSKMEKGPKANLITCIISSIIVTIGLILIAMMQFAPTSMLVSMLKTVGLCKHIVGYSIDPYHDIHVSENISYNLHQNETQFKNLTNNTLTTKESTVTVDVFTDEDYDDDEKGKEKKIGEEKKDMEGKEKKGNADDKHGQGKDKTEKDGKGKEEKDRGKDKYDKQKDDTAKDKKGEHEITFEHLHNISKMILHFNTTSTTKKSTVVIDVFTDEDDGMEKDEKTSAEKDKDKEGKQEKNKYKKGKDKTGKYEKGTQEKDKGNNKYDKQKDETTEDKRGEHEITFEHLHNISKIQLHMNTTSTPKKSTEVIDVFTDVDDETGKDEKIDKEAGKDKEGKEKEKGKHENDEQEKGKDETYKKKDKSEKSKKGQDHTGTKGKNKGGKEQHKKDKGGKENGKDGKMKHDQDEGDQENDEKSESSQDSEEKNDSKGVYYRPPYRFNTTDDIPKEFDNEKSINDEKSDSHKAVQHEKDYAYDILSTDNAHVKKPQDEQSNKIINKSDRNKNPKYEQTTEVIETIYYRPPYRIEPDRPTQEISDIFVNTTGSIDDNQHDFSYESIAEKDINFSNITNDKKPTKHEKDNVSYDHPSKGKEFHKKLLDKAMNYTDEFEDIYYRPPYRIEQTNPAKVDTVASSANSNKKGSFRSVAEKTTYIDEKSNAHRPIKQEKAKKYHKELKDQESAEDIVKRVLNGKLRKQTDHQTEKDIYYRPPYRVDPNIVDSLEDLDLLVNPIDSHQRDFPLNSALLKPYKFKTSMDDEKSTSQLKKDNLVENEKTTDDFQGIYFRPPYRVDPIRIDINDSLEKPNRLSVQGLSTTRVNTHKQITESWDTDTHSLPSLQESFEERTRLSEELKEQGNKKSNSEIDFRPSYRHGVYSTEGVKDDDRPILELIAAEKNDDDDEAMAETLSPRDDWLTEPTAEGEAYHPAPPDYNN